MLLASCHVETDIHLCLWKSRILEAHHEGRVQLGRCTNEAKCCVILLMAITIVIIRHCCLNFGNHNCHRDISLLDFLQMKQAGRKCILTMHSTEYGRCGNVNFDGNVSFPTFLQSHLPFRSHMRIIFLSGRKRFFFSFFICPRMQKAEASRGQAAIM